MRLIVSSSILSIATGSVVQFKSNGGAALETKHDVTKQVEAAHTPILHTGERFLGQECKPATEIDSDVGILGCRNPKALCEEDEISSLGGRCTLDRSLLTPKINQPIFSNRHTPHLAQTPREDTPRFLQNSGWSCPSNCPKEFCKCAQKYGEVKHCTKEMDNLCIDGIVSECVPGDYLPFYYQTYCPFAECIVANNAYQDCSCQYYRDYCSLYYAFDESTSKCNIAGCCEAAGSVDEKIQCLPGLQPSFSPTMYPTTSAVPTGAPSVSSNPTISPKPTVSPKPTPSPTVSHEPTISKAPTDAPSASPSFSPTVTFAPTTPSDNPSMSPTVTTSPSVTISPTDQPTDSSKPTISSAPSSAPTISIEPTGAPTDKPTISFSPTETPKTDAPTYAPTNKPSRRPTRKPTQKPTLPPNEQTAAPTEALNVSELNSSYAAKSTMITSLVVAGVAWFLMG